MPRDSPTGRFRQRMLRWALRRQGVDAPPLTLAPRRIYILPTRAGWTFALLIAAMFIAGMNYGNGLALLLCFWLTGFALVAMIRTQRSLAGAQLLRAVAAPTFTGMPLLLTLEIRCALHTQDLRITAEDLDGVEPPAGIEPAGACNLRLRFNSRQRGRWKAPVIRLQSSAPFGLFRTWTWLALDVSTVVYPRALGERRVPEAAGGGGSRPLTGSLDELAGLRAWREGDSPRQVAWKAYARGAPLLVREYQGHAATTLDFDYASLRMRDPEARLSQLTRWVVDAATQSQSWTLRLPGMVLSGSGTEHRRRCLEALALFEREPHR
jgi:uncharacterized protein (DUF58 family)